MTPLTDNIPILDDQDHAAEVAVELAEPTAEDTPSVRAVIYCKDPTEAFELDILNMEGVIIGMRVDGSAVLYIPWGRVKHLEVPRSLNEAEPADAE